MSRDPTEEVPTDMHTNTHPESVVLIILHCNKNIQVVVLFIALEEATGSDQDLVFNYKQIMTQ